MTPRPITSVSASADQQIGRTVTSRSGTSETHICALVRVGYYLAGSTIWVHRNNAIRRPVDSFVTVASQTWV